MNASEAATANDPSQDNGTDLKPAASGGNAEPVVTGSARAASSAKSSLPLLSLILAIVALTAAGWTGWQLLALKDVPALVSGDAGRIADLSRQLQQLTAVSERQKDLLDNLESSLESSVSVIPELSQRLQQSEQQLASVPGINTQSRVTWLKSEALYYLQIANAQATLAGNAKVAASALQLADDKLRDTGDPSLTPVRARLSKEIAALKALPAIDLTGISFRLQAMAAQAREWPFRSAAPDSFVPGVQVPEADAGQAAWDRFVVTVKAVLNSIVSVKETDGPRVTQLGSAEQTIVVEALKAELQIARLALIGGNTELFQQAVGRASEQLSLYFDTESTAVAAALDGLSELQALELAGSLPDISGSLVLMRSMTNGAVATAGSDNP